MPLTIKQVRNNAIPGAGNLVCHHLILSNDLVEGLQCAISRTGQRFSQVKSPSDASASVAAICAAWHRCRARGAATLGDARSHGQISAYACIWMLTLHISSFFLDKKNKI